MIIRILHIALVLIAVESSCVARGSDRAGGAVEGSPPALLADAPIATELPREIFRHWLSSREEDADGVKVYRAKGYKFPPARGRPSFEIKENGEFIAFDIGRADRPEKIVGTWKSEGKDKLVASFAGKEREPITLNIISVDGEVLKVRK